MCAAKTNKKDGKRFTEIRNSKALRDYSIEERFEAGIKLQGTEVKAIRAGRAQINDAFGRFDKGDLWLMNAHIDEYAFGSFNNHDTRRTRKLLLQRSELNGLIGAVERKGYTLVPLRLHWRNGKAKLEIGLAKGKKAHDKRATEKDRDWAREKSRLLKVRTR